MRHFFEYIQKDPGDITVYDVRDFLLMKSDTISATTINHYNSAIHFFFRRVLHKPWDDDIIPRMKEDYHLPVILSPDEINLLLDSVTDIKYKAIFSLLYGSGLRVSEVVALDYCIIIVKGACSVLRPVFSLASLKDFPLITFIDLSCLLGTV